MFTFVAWYAGADSEFYEGFVRVVQQAVIIVREARSLVESWGMLPQLGFLKRIWCILVGEPRAAMES